MDKKAVAESLRALASDDKKRSQAARLRDVIDDVEAAMSAGVSREAVVGVLAKHGLVMTLATFDSTLRRIRQKRGKPAVTEAKPAGRPALPEKPQEAAPVVETPATADMSVVTPSHNPADIDRIMGSKPDLDALARNFKKGKKP